MNILAIDTAGKSAGVAILAEDALRYECTLNAGFTHSETLLPMVDAALRQTGLTLDDSGLYAVNAGPGSFTGLRIGLAAVKGLALPRQTPCAAVSTLAALAACHTGEGTVVCALDARRGQVYWAAFDLAAHTRLTPDDAAPVAALAAFLKNCKKPYFFVGDGAALCYNEYGQMPGCLFVPAAAGASRAAGTALIAQKMAAAGQTVSAAALLPCYHRLSQAERERAQREAAQKTEL